VEANLFQTFRLGSDNFFSVAATLPPQLIRIGYRWEVVRKWSVISKTVVSKAIGLAELGTGRAQSGTAPCNLAWAPCTLI